MDMQMRFVAFHTGKKKDYCPSPLSPLPSPPIHGCLHKLLKRDSGGGHLFVFFLPSITHPHVSLHTWERQPISHVPLPSPFLRGVGFAFRGLFFERLTRQPVSHLPSPHYSCVVSFSNGSRVSSPCRKTERGVEHGEVVAVVVLLIYIFTYNYYTHATSSLLDAIRS